MRELNIMSYVKDFGVIDRDGNTYVDKEEFMAWWDK